MNLKRIDEAISNKIDNEQELEAEVGEADEYLDQLVEKRYRIQFLITPYQTASSNTNTSFAYHSTENQEGPSVTQSGSPQSNSVKTHHLPKLSIPTFNGDLLKWQTFWDTFQTAVLTDSSLSDIQKFNYLKGHL